MDAAAPSGSEFDSARAIVEHLRHSRQDLDAGLSPAQTAEAAAFAALVEAKLEPAMLWTTWCEAESFSKHTQVREHESSRHSFGRALAGWLGVQAVKLLQTVGCTLTEPPSTHR